MPAGYSARCRVCNSPHRVEIERWCRDEGLSPRRAAARLLEEHGEKISHMSIRQHMRDHFDVRAEAREQYRRSQEQFEQQVAKQLSDIEMLDQIARGNFELYQAARAWLAELVEARERVPKALVDLLEVTAGEVRQQLKQKADLLGEDPLDDLSQVLLALADVADDASDA